MLHNDVQSVVHPPPRVRKRPNEKVVKEADSLPAEPQTKRQKIKLKSRAAAQADQQRNAPDPSCEVSQSEVPVSDPPLVDPEAGWVVLTYRPSGRDKMFAYHRLLYDTEPNAAMSNFIIEFVTGRARMPASSLSRFGLCRDDVVLGPRDFA